MIGLLKRIKFALTPKHNRRWEVRYQVDERVWRATKYTDLRAAEFMAFALNMRGVVNTVTRVK